MAQVFIKLEDGSERVLFEPHALIARSIAQSTATTRQEPVWVRGAYEDSTEQRVDPLTPPAP